MRPSRATIFAHCINRKVCILCKKQNITDGVILPVLLIYVCEDYYEGRVISVWYETDERSTVSGHRVKRTKVWRPLGLM